jgi:hypothetical protein
MISLWSDQRVGANALARAGNQASGRKPWARGFRRCVAETTLRTRFKASARLQFFTRSAASHQKRGQPGAGLPGMAWQGTQYMRSMFEGWAKLEPLDNDRHPGMRWRIARDVLSARQVNSPARRQDLGGRLVQDRVDPPRWIRRSRHLLCSALCDPAGAARDSGHRAREIADREHAPDGDLSIHEGTATFVVWLGRNHFEGLACLRCALSHHTASGHPARANCAQALRLRVVEQFVIEERRTARPVDIGRVRRTLS